MNKKVEEKVNKVLSLVSEFERQKNRLLVKQTERVLLTMQYLKAKTKNLKVAT